MHYEDCFWSPRLGRDPTRPKADLSSIPRCADAEARRHREDEVAGGWAEVAGPGAGHVCGGDDWGMLLSST